MPGVVHIGRLLTIGETLPHLPAELRGKAISQLTQVSELMIRRQARGFTIWDTRAPLYAQNLMKLMRMLRVSIHEYIVTARNIQIGNKGGTQAQLSRIVETLLLPALEEDLRQPQFHPLDPGNWPEACPGMERRNEHGRKITNPHTVGECPVWLEWDYHSLEPSQWHAQWADKYMGVSEISPGHAVQKALAGGKAAEAMDYEEYHKTYSLEELKKMPGFRIRSIARKRRIPAAGGLKQIRTAIACPQVDLLSP